MNCSSLQRLSPQSLRIGPAADSCAAVIFTAASAFGQAKSETTKQQVEGVRNTKIDAKNNGLQVSYDPSKTTPQKIVAAFNKENPDTLLKSSEGKEPK
jgi:hypothetical protein